MKWNPLPALRAISRFAYESAAQRLAANVIFAVICLCACLVGLGLFFAYVMLRRLLFVLVLLALAACAVERPGVSSSPCATCAGEGVNQITDAKTAILCAALAACTGEGTKALDGGAPYRGPAPLDASADAVSLADVPPDVVLLPPEVTPDLPPEVTPDLPVLVDTSPPPCPNLPTGAYSTPTRCTDATDAAGSLPCWAASTDAGPVALCRRTLPDASAPLGWYAPACAECPR